MQRPQAANCRADRLSYTGKHFHQRVDGELGRLEVHDVRNTRARGHQDPGGPRLFQVMLLNPGDSPLRRRPARRPGVLVPRGKDRYLTAAGVVLDMHSPELADAADAVAGFATLAGPVIDGHAFCDIQAQQLFLSMSDMPFAQCHQAPDQFHDTKWPGSGKKPVGRRAQAGNGKGQCKPGRSRLQSIEQHHQGHDRSAV